MQALKIDFQIRQNDLLPTLKGELFDSRDQKVLTEGAQVWLNMKRPEDTDPLIRKQALVRDVGLATEFVEYLWSEDDTAEPGIYQAWWEVDLPGGRISFPNNEFFVVEVFAQEVEHEGLARFRRLVADRIPAEGSDRDTFWTNAELLDLLNNVGAGSLNAAAYYAWEEKVSAYAELVDTDESGSHRRLSQKYRQAKERADHFATTGGIGPNRVRRPPVGAVAFSLRDYESVDALPTADTIPATTPYVRLYPLKRFKAVL